MLKESVVLDFLGALHQLITVNSTVNRRVQLRRLSVEPACEVEGEEEGKKRKNDNLCHNSHSPGTYF